LVRERVQLVHVPGDSLFLLARRRIAELAIANRLPTICVLREFVIEGVLMSYGIIGADSLHRLAFYIDKILKGTKPGDLPIEQPARFEFVANLTTAKTLGITFPPSIMTLVDELIE
jgi:putative ABC transport system substrate-binding protein